MRPPERPNPPFHYSVHPPGGDVILPLAYHRWDCKNNGALTLRLNPKRADYLKIKGITMKNIPDTDTMSRLSLSEKGWKGSGLPEMGLTLSTLEYLASNWGLSSSLFTTHIPTWTIELPHEAITLLFFISYRSNLEDMLRERRLELCGNQMISDLYEDIADVPLPPPNQWDPSHKSVLLSSFSRTPGILWLQSGSGINHVIDQFWYVTHIMVDSHVTAGGH